MALWDRDKTSLNRLNPSPQSRDVNQNRLAHGTAGFTLKQEDTDTTLGKLVVKDGRLVLIKDDSTFVDLSNGNIEVIRADQTVVGRLGYRTDDSDGAIDVAKPGEAL